MNTIKRKLRSRAGESLLMAMVFMLFCAFIGGSVLAAATANAQRVAQIAEQQDFLLERSAAMLLSDQVQPNPSSGLEIDVIDSKRSIQRVTKLNDGGAYIPEGEPTHDRLISFESSESNLTAMQQLMLETTVWRYLRENAPDYDPNNVTLIGFPGGATKLSEMKFQYTMPSAESTNYTIEGQLSVTNNITSVSMPEYTANFSSGRGDELYDFFVDFGEMSQLKLTVNSRNASPNYTVVTSPITLMGSNYVRITSDTTAFSISWYNPKIEKGGAE